MGVIFADRFALEGLLGDGGLGRVFRARDLKSGQVFALKCLRAEYAKEGRILKRFLREARAAGSLVHPNVVRMYGYGQDRAGVPYLAMELCNGTSMADLRDEAPDLQKILGLIDQLLQALQYIHDHGVVHRDIKPENVIILPPQTPNDQPCVKLIDFGLALVNGDDATQRRGDALGTPQYMAPEQASGHGSVGPWTDLYAVGIILYEFLSGHPPFSGAHGMAVALKHVLEAVEPLTPREGLVLPPGLEAVVMHALEKDPAARFASADEMRAALAPFHSPSISMERQPIHDFEAIDSFTDFQKTQAEPENEPEYEAGELFMLQGRESELNWLWQRAHMVVDGQPQLIAIAGDLGLGRSSLVAWLRDQILDGDWMRVLGGPHALGGACRAILSQVFGQLPCDRLAAESQVRSVLQLLGAQDSFSLEEHALLAASLIAGDELLERIDDFEVAHHLQFNACFIKLLETLAANRPLMIHLDESEVTDEDVVVLSALAASLKEHPFPILILLTYSPEHAGNTTESAIGQLLQHVASNVETLTLRPLEPAAMAAGFDAILPLEPSVFSQLYAHSNGNSRFAWGLLELFLEQGILCLSENRVIWQSQPQRWPESLGQVFRRQARFRLERAHQEELFGALEWIALLGASFDRLALECILFRLLGSIEAVKNCIERLVHERILVEQRASLFSFCHASMREILRRGVSTHPNEPLLYRACAEALVSALNGEGDLYAAEELAVLYEHAQCWKEAAQCYERAAERARRLGFEMRPYDLLKHGDALISEEKQGDLGQLRALLRLRVAANDVQRGRFERAWQILAGVGKWASRVKDPVVDGQTLLQMADLLKKQGKLEGALRTYGQAMGRFQRLNDQRSVARCILGTARIEQQIGDASMAIQLLEQGAALMKSEGDRLSQAQALEIAANWAIERGEFMRAQNMLEEAISVAESLGEYRLQSLCCYLMGETRRRLKDYSEARRCLSKALQLAYELKADEISAKVHIALARLAVTQHDFQAALPQFQRALEFGEALKDRRKAAKLNIEIGLLAIDAGYWQAAEKVILRALNDADENPARQAVCYVTLAYLAAERGDSARCDQAIAAALECNHRTPAKDLKFGWALECIASTQMATIRPHWALGVLQRALEFYRDNHLPEEAIQRVKDKIVTIQNY